jgi:hypothetical protein
MALTPRLTNYGFDQVVFTLGGIIIDGFDEGEGFTISTEPGFTKKVGADGKVTRSKMMNRSATIELKLLQSSATNDALAALFNLDIAAPNGAGVVPLFIRDGSGRAVYKAAEAWIASAPADVAFGEEATTRTWMIDCAVLERFDGGN